MYSMKAKVWFLNTGLLFLSIVRECVDNYYLDNFSAEQGVP